MCGLNGIYAFAPSAAAVGRAELVATRDSMARRGPDGAGLWIAPDGRIGLAHRRLAIIELSSLAAQPMATPDGRLQIVFNGEIYNFLELRSELETCGVRFRSHSDTEVLLYMYLHHGPAMVEHLRGMFSFAIWDTRTRELFLARDRFGMKPLYYAVDGGQFRFASQTKALLAGGGVSREIGASGITGFLLWGSIPEPFTIYRAIRALPAGHTLRVTGQGVADAAPYWDLPAAMNSSREYSETIPAGGETEAVRTALLDSVQHHLIADVPVGAFLSAGLDSSSIVGLALENDRTRCETITLGFKEFRNKHHNEVPGASSIAAHFGAAHHVQIVSMEEVERDLPAFLEAMDQPTIDGLNTWYVSKAAQERGLKVALSGLGGDELLGGYVSFGQLPRHRSRCARLGRLALLSDTYRRLHQHLIEPVFKKDPRGSAALHACRNVWDLYRLDRGLFMPWELPKIIDTDLARAGMEELTQEQCRKNAELEQLGANPFALVSYLETTRYMRNQLLRDTDWIGMHFSLEIRVPFVDHLLLEAVTGLAATGRLGEGKTVLARVLRNGLPPNIVKRKKSGFVIPIWNWLNNSPDLGAWKRSSFLRRTYNRAIRRWAYVLLERQPECRSVLKTG